MKRVAVAASLLLLVLAVVAGGLLGREALRGPDLCDPATAFREWRKAAATEPYSPERLAAAQPVADALVGCDRPLVGLRRAEVRARLGRPDRVAATGEWTYDLGSGPGGSIEPGLFVAFAQDGAVRSATTPPSRTKRRFDRSAER